MFSLLLGTTCLLAAEIVAYSASQITLAKLGNQQIMKHRFKRQVASSEVSVADVALILDRHNTFRLLESATNMHVLVGAIF